MINLEILKNLIVYNAINTKIRYGRNIDGGYVIVDGYDYDFFISGGAGDDISFEIDFIKKYPNIQGILFDGSVDHPKNLPQQIKFIKKNIGFNDENITDLTEYIQKYKNIFIKLDIEGGEVDLLRSSFIESLINVKQIVFELHDIFSLNKEKVLESLKNINKTHYLVHVHENNNWYNMVDIENNLYSELLELTFIRKDCEIAGLNKIDFPIIGIDFPNAPKLLQHNMNIWPFNFKIK